MLHLEAILWIIVFKGVEAVGRGREHACDAQALEGLLVFFHHHLEQTQLAQATHLASAAILLSAQDAEVQPAALKKANDGTRHPLDARVVRRRAADVIQVLGTLLDGFNYHITHPSSTVLARHG